ncbi:hypothetical protein [Methylobrevis pamukkalensis]|uniref:Uncharacterized protein n=1 Tax=Methylobrevis pamukkalensis TaxID=1439726 RepID=A0A1E3H0T7_9HYPH|nr:hypothetical protein [Methylobrevis pamukkalensis]ODN69904.1 hypothetical protein A6302_02786 [Methylobrevis pamukkalensis]
MKNVMIVDGAENCAYDLYELSDEDFAVIFPGDGQDIQFVDELDGMASADAILAGMWTRPVAKKKASGIHGILFYELSGKKEYYPNRRDSDLDFKGRPFSIESI